MFSNKSKIGRKVIIPLLMIVIAMGAVGLNQYSLYLRQKQQMDELENIRQAQVDEAYALMFFISYNA